MPARCGPGRCGLRVRRTRWGTGWPYEDGDTMTVTTGERVCPDGCGEKPTGDYRFAGRTEQEREKHRARGGRATRAQEKALAVQLEQARSVLQGRGVDLDAGAEVLAEGLCRDGETLMATATVVAATLRESGAEVMIQIASGARQRRAPPDG